MVINNFTVNVVSFPVTVGSIISNTRPVAVLLLEPLMGYSINAVNFSALSPLPSYVASAVFTQVGNNIVCTITYIASSVMPSNDVLVSVCASGYAEETGVTISGTNNQCSVSNTLIPVVGQSNVPYSSSGAAGGSVMVFNQTVTAATGYFFEAVPFYAVTVGNTSNYSITNTKSYNVSGQLIQVVFDVSYTFPSGDVSGDIICLTANAKEIYDPPKKIVSYSYSTPLTGCLSQVSNTTPYTISGITGAAWSLTVVESDGTTVFSDAGVIDTTGIKTLSIAFPAVQSNKIYTFTLSGDLAATFYQTIPLQNPVFTVCQGTFVQLYFSTDSVNPCCNITEGTYIFAGGSTFDTATSILQSDQTRAIDGYYSI